MKKKPLKPCKPKGAAWKIRHHWMNMIKTGERRCLSCWKKESELRV